MDNKVIASLKDKKINWMSVSQKSIVIFGIIFYGLLAVYSLTMCTPMGLLVNLDNKTHKYTMPLYNMTHLVDNLLIIGIIGLALIAVYSLLKNDKRRIYYISNKVFGIINIAYALFTSIYLIYVVIYYQQQFFTIDFAYANKNLPVLTADKTAAINEDTPVFGLGYALGSLGLIYCAYCVYAYVTKLISGKQLTKEIYGDEKAVVSEVK